MRKLLLFLWTCMSTIGVFAQSKTISGTVTNKETGVPLPAVTVTVKGTSVATQTKPDGTFAIEVPASAKVLVFSSVGYGRQEISIGASNTIDVGMTQGEGEKLDEVVVVAYGAQKRKDVTGAISVVNEKAIKRQQVTTVAQALQGTASGVVVINNSGQPGTNPQIRIRGIASVNASAEPLIVLDGIPFDGNLNSINPNDIESFSVLKDASATALYGSRAANGVILITTKSGRRGARPSINVNSTFGLSSRALPEYSFVNSQQMFELGWEALKNLNTGVVPNPEQFATDNLVSEIKYNPYGIAKPVGPDGRLVSGATLLWNTDWEKELTRDQALRKDVNLDISGGSDKSRYFISGGYLDQEGYLVTSRFQRVTTRFNYAADIRDWLQVGLKSSIVYSDQNFPVQTGSSFLNVVQAIRQMSSIYPVYKRGNNGELLLDIAGNPIFDFGEPDPTRTVNRDRNTLQPSNLLGTTLADRVRNERLLTNLNVFTDINFTRELKFRSNFGIDRASISGSNYQNPELGNSSNVGGRLQRVENLTTSWTWNNMLNYRKSFGEHTVDVMASIESYKYSLRTLTAQKTGFPFGGLYELSSAATNELTTGSVTDETLLSYLSRIKYDFRGRYFIEGTVRWDGSSRFPEDNRWGFFPAVGVSWIVSEENFMQGINNLDLLKFRASYGQIGNKQLPAFFPYLNQFATGYDDLENPGVYFNTLGNPKLRWEKQGNLNIGLDFAVLDNRLSGSIDFFKKDAIDLLFAKPLVFSGGVPTVDDNIGKMTNSGVELSLNGTIIKKKNFTWDAGFNITYLKNEIKALPQAQINNLPTNQYRMEVGQPFLNFFFAEWAGVDPTNGDPLWYQDELDASGNPTGKRITTNDWDVATRYYHGTAIPKYSGGFQTAFAYKRFELNALVNYALGGKYYDADYAGLMHGFTAGYGTQLHSDILRRWQKAGDVTDVPRLDENNTDIVQNSTRFLFDGSYARLRSVTLSYTFIPSKNTEIVKSARFFVQGDNLLTWSKLKRGADPETDVDGRTRTTTSPFKIMSVGLEISL